MAKAYFREEDGVFRGNDPVRGPWSPDHCHAGPVAGLVVRAAEQAVGEGKILTRLTMDVIRPLPLAGLRVAADVGRLSRTLGTTRVTVHDLDGTLCAVATTMHLTRKSLGEVPTAPVSAPDFAAAKQVEWNLVGSLHDKPAFGQFVEIAMPPGQEQRLGPKMIWMRTPKLLEGETQSPVQSVCPLADCGNGISFNATSDVLGFMNTDLTVQIHREPVSDWLASDAVSHWHGTGIGMSHATLYDTQGPIGVALQTLVLHPPRQV